VSEYYGVGDVDQTTTTDGSGAYELTVIGGAFIRVGFAAPGYVSQFYNGKPSLASADFIRTAFTCGFTSQPSISAGIDAALAPSVPPLTNPPPATPTVPLALSAVRESHRNWRRNGTPPRTTIVGRTPIGTTFRFNLNEAARMRFVFTQPLSGRMMGGRCVAQTSKNRRRHACTRSVARGALSFSGHPGLNKVVFQGRLSRSRTLTPGRYMLIIVATDAAGQRATARLTFTIVG
jgi:hypothetical protein